MDKDKRGQKPTEPLGKTSRVNKNVLEQKDSSYRNWAIRKNNRLHKTRNATKVVKQYVDLQHSND